MLCCTDFSRSVDVARHDADLALVRLDDARTVRANNSSNVLRSQSMLDLDHVLLRNTIGDDDDEVELGFNSFEHGVLSERWRDVDHRGVGTGLLLSFSTIFEDRKAHVSASGLLR